MKWYTYIVLTIFGAAFWGLVVDVLITRISQGTSDGGQLGFAAAMV